MASTPIKCRMYNIRIKQMQANITFLYYSNLIYKTCKILSWSFSVKYMYFLDEMYLLSPCRSQLRDHQVDTLPPKNCHTSDSNGPSATVNKINQVQI